MKTEPTFQATIYLSLTECYQGRKHSLGGLRKRLLTFIKDQSRTSSMHYFCVSVTPLEYVYLGGSEKGVAVGVINYPRNPESESALTQKTLELAKYLRKEFNQVRLSVVFNKQTVMLEGSDK